MKKYLFYSLFLSLAMGFYNCSDSDDGEPEPEPTDPINTYFKDEIKPQASVSMLIHFPPPSPVPGARSRPLSM